AGLRPLCLRPSLHDALPISPPGVYRSDDGGDTWRNMADPGLPDRVIMAFACRVMPLDVDPNSPDDIYATLEANGAMRSRNGGERDRKSTRLNSSHGSSSYAV